MNLDIEWRVCHTLAPELYRERFMRQLLQVLVIGIVFSVFFSLALSPRKAHAYESKLTQAKQKHSKSSSLKEFEDSFLRNIRLINQKLD